jgi:hypothetical protein
MKFLFIVLLVLSATLMCNKIHSQHNIDSIRTNNAGIKISIHSLLGNWYAADSSHSKITFERDGVFYVILKPLKHGVDYYRFQCDSDSVYVNGTAANWPPFDCTANLVDANTLELMFYQYFSKETNNVIYNRK